MLENKYTKSKFIIAKHNTHPLFYGCTERNDRLPVGLAHVESLNARIVTERCYKQMRKFIEYGY